MKIYTKKGDKGETALYGGKKVSKASLQVDAYGTVDELIAHIGHISELPVLKSQHHILKQVQHTLFVIGSILASDPDKQKLFLPELNTEEIDNLEQQIDLISEKLEPLKYFVLPGGCIENTTVHLCRTVCRRAERKCVELSEICEIPTKLITYLNRLSDYLFILSRLVSKELKAPEIYWKPSKDKS